MNHSKLKKALTRVTAALLGIGIGLAPIGTPLSARVQAAVTASSGEYVSGVTYSHNPRFEGYSIVNGIDVSSYQKTVDWNAVKADGIDYAFVRVGFRGYGDTGTLNQDGKYKQNLENAPKAGIKVGVYMYSQAITVEEAIEEANFILERIKGYEITLPVVFDFEYAATGLGRLYHAKLSKREATDICAAFCETVSAAGYTPMIYANKNMLETKMYADELDDKYQIWLANYTNKTSYAGDYQYWQYSSSGKVDGITTGRVDVNFFYTLDSSYKNIEIDHQSAEPTDVDATIRVNVQNPGGGIVSQIGFQLYNSYGLPIDTYFDSCSFSSYSVSYEGKLSDYGVKLNARTTYTYRPFAKVGTNTYYGTTQYFTTTEPSVRITETVTPTEQNASIAVQLSNPALTRIETVGYHIYSAVGARLGSYQTYVYSNAEAPFYTFDVAAQTGVQLTPDTTYQYEMYTTHDGKTESMGRKTFTTLSPNAVTSLSLSQTHLELGKNSLSARLYAFYTPSAPVQEVVWSSSDPSVALVDQSGNVTAVAGGTALITASIGSVSAGCTVNVTGLTPKLSLDLTSVELAIGDIALITPYYEAGETSFDSYTWLSSDPDVATVDRYGIVIGMANGRATLRCTLKADPRVYAECEVVVKQPVVYHLNGGTNSKKNPIDLQPGKKLTLSAPTRAGYLFEGWYTEPTFLNRVTEITLAEEETISLYAKWSENTLTAPNIKSVYTKIGGELTVILEEEVPGAVGYQYVYSYYADFKKYKYTSSPALEKTVAVKLNTKCYVKVRAYMTDPSGKRVYSAYSDVVKVTSASTKPDALSGVKASSAAKGQIKVAVAKAVKNCYGYQYFIATDPGFTENTKYITTRNRSYTFKDLPAGTYYVRGRTYNNDKVAGGYAYSAYTKAVKLTIKSNKPQNLKGISVSSSAVGTLTVEINQKVEGATGYQYLIATDPAFKNKKYINKTTPAYTFTELEDGTYYVKARAFIKNPSTKKNTYSAYTSVLTITLLAPEPLPEPLGGVLAEQTEKGSLKVKVAAPVLSCYGYQYVISADESFANAIEVDTRMRSHVFTELPKGKYYVKGRTYNQSTRGEGNIYGDFCETVTIDVESDIPESLLGVKAEQTAAGKLKIAVTAPVLSCYGYRYEIALSEDFSDARFVDTRYRSYTFSNLSPGTYYLRGCTYDEYDDADGKIYGRYCPVISFTVS